MRSTHPAAVAMVLLSAAGAVEAQERPPDPRDPQQQNLNVDALPINVDRIRRELQQAITVREEMDGLNLRYDIQVYGRAPEIQLFTPEDNLTTGPVPYGAPTHKELVDHVTPKEFRAPVMDLNALFKWLAEQVGK